MASIGGSGQDWAIPNKGDSKEAESENRVRSAGSPGCQRGWTCARGLGSRTLQAGWEGLGSWCQL